MREEGLYKYTGPEKRAHKRIYRNFAAGFRDNLSPGWDIVTLENLSAGGALFRYDRELPTESVITMRITLPVLDAPVTCLAKIIRVEKERKSLLFRTAARFSEIGGKEKSAINNLAKDSY